MKRYFVVWGAFVAGFAFAGQARADECTVSYTIFVFGPGYQVSCIVRGATVSGSSGDVLGQFTLPEMDPSLGQLFGPFNADFALAQPTCSQFGGCVLTGNASLFYGPQCIFFNPSPPPPCLQYRADNFGYGAVLSVAGPTGSFDLTAYGNGSVFPPDPDVPREISVPWRATFNPSGFAFGQNWPIGTDQLTFDISVEGTCTLNDPMHSPIIPCASLTSVDPFSYTATLSYITSVPEPSLFMLVGVGLAGVAYVVQRSRTPQELKPPAES